MKRFTLWNIIAYWRAFWGYCPACNLDAPAIDICVVCQSYRGHFPPPPWLPGEWLRRYFLYIGGNLK